MMQDPVADMLTRIRNSIRVNQEKVDIPFSRFKKEIIKVMKNEGLIRNFKLLPGDDGRQVIRVFIKYADNGEPVMTRLERASKPSRRRYVGAAGIPRKLNGLAVTVMSTSAGVVSANKARSLGVGGEVICHLW